MNNTHHLSVVYKAEYEAWHTMKARCLNKNNHAYHRYGGRGIRVCLRWRQSFAEFFKDMGPKPTSKHQLDRYPDNDGNYKPSNCRWATPQENCRNRNNRRLLTYQGETLCLAEWAERLGIGWEVLDGRIKRGWTAKEIVETPATLRKPHKQERSNIKLITIGNQTKSLARWCKELTRSYTLVAQRIRAGWSAEKALITPPRNYKKS